MAWPEKEKLRIFVWCLTDNAVMTMHQGRSDMSAGNEDKNPPPLESQFYAIL